MLYDPNTIFWFIIRWIIISLYLYVFNFYLNQFKINFLSVFLTSKKSLKKKNIIKTLRITKIFFFNFFWLNCAYFTQRLFSMFLISWIIRLFSFPYKGLTTSQMLIILFFCHTLIRNWSDLMLISKGSIKSFWTWFGFQVILHFLILFLIKFYISDNNWLLANDRHIFEIIYLIIFLTCSLFWSPCLTFFIWIFFLSYQFFHLLRSLTLTFLMFSFLWNIVNFSLHFLLLFFVYFLSNFFLLMISLFGLFLIFLKFLRWWFLFGHFGLL